MDRIKIEGLTFFAYHGVHDEEAKLGQRFTVDVNCGIDLSLAGKSDNLNDSVSYSDLARVVGEVVTKQRFKLIERLAESIIDSLFQMDGRILELRVRVHKPNASLMSSTGTASVELIRQRKS